MDEKSELQALQAEFKRLTKPLEPFTKIKLSDPEALDQLSTALQKLPAGAVFGSALDELREKTRSLVEGTRRQRVQAFGRILTEYIKDAEARGESIRELNNVWRVGPLELELRREQGQARFLYNHEPLTPWKPVGSGEDLAKLGGQASTLLNESSIPQDELIESFWNAYRSCVWRGKEMRAGMGEVPALNLYAELRLERGRRELDRGKPDRKLSTTEMPRWAFLYNLDRYRLLGGSIPADRRLGFQTGSQAETAKIGVTINGLDPRQDYKKICYVIRATA